MKQIAAQPLAAAESAGEKQPHLLWLFPAPLEDRLDSSTWLDTTRELRNLGWRVTLICIGPLGVQLYQGVEVFCIPVRDVYLLGKAGFHVDALKYILERFDDIDIVYFHQISGIWLFPLRSYRVVRGRELPLLVMDTRDITDLDRGDLRSVLRYGFDQLNHRLAGRMADGQTTITDRFVSLVRIRPSKLWGIWPSGVDRESFAMLSQSRVWPQEEEAIRLVYVGIFLERRNLVPLCHAVQAANDLGCAFELFLAGDGPDAKRLAECAEQSRGAVQLMDPVPHDQVPGLLATMHVGVTSLPDVEDVKYGASSPVKLFEYMASGMPILATRNPCHSDVARDGRYTFWVDEVTEAGILAGLKQLWSERANLQELGAQAQLEAEQWTWAASARKLDKALRSGLVRATGK